MVDRDLGDAKAAIGGEHRDEAVELPVQPHALQHLRAIRLQPAVDVVEVHAGDGAGRPVEDAGEESSQDRVVPSRLPAGDEVEALVELREHLRDLGGIVLEVGVDRHDELAASFEEPGLQRGSLPEVPAEVDHHDVRHLVVQA